MIPIGTQQVALEVGKRRKTQSRISSWEKGWMCVDGQKLKMICSRDREGRKVTFGLEGPTIEGRVAQKKLSLTEGSPGSERL